MAVLLLVKTATSYTPISKQYFATSLASFNKGYQQPETKRGAFEAAKGSDIKMPCVILVNPFLDANIGSASRAMLNFGLTELRLVAPNCNHLSDNSRALAAGSFEILENAKIFPTLSECIADLSKVYATTVRPRHMTQMVYTPSSAARDIMVKPEGEHFGIMFGTERSGLSNEDVALADSIISIPTFKHFSSLNLAQAVNIVAYEVWKASLELDGSLPPDTWLHRKDGTGRFAKKGEIDGLMDRLTSFLDRKDYQKNPSKREIVFRSIKNILQRVT